MVINKIIYNFIFFIELLNIKIRYKLKIPFIKVLFYILGY